MNFALSPSYHSAIAQAAYLMLECKLNRVDAVSDAAQYFGLRFNHLFMACDGLNGYRLASYL